MLCRSGFGCACIFALAFTLTARHQAESRLAERIEIAKNEEASIAEGAVRVAAHKVPRGRSFYDSLLTTAGLDAGTAAKVVRAMQEQFDLRRVRAGNDLAVVHAGGQVQAVRYHIDTDRALWVLARDEDFAAEIRQVPSTTDVVGVTGVVRSSLYHAMAETGETPELTMRMADIFGWDIDFYTDPRQGDTFRLVVEKKTYATGAVSYGRLLAAEYNNRGKAYQAVLFRDPQGNPAYYQPDGKSMKKAFLRSPLKFNARVSSGFSHRRFHPVLKTYRPHLGVDYAAPTGTPVQTIGDGRVTFAGVKGGGGRTVEISHANGYTTSYLHLSRIFVRAGQRVSQGERIGLVGATGLATGPHLDFRIRQKGVYRNFEALRLPPAEPVGQRDRGEFLAQRDHAMALLPPLGGVRLELARGYKANSTASD